MKFGPVHKIKKKHAMTLNKFKGDIMLIIYDLIGFFSLYLILSNADIKFGKKQFLLTFSLQKKY